MKIIDTPGDDRSKVVDNTIPDDIITHVTHKLSCPTKTSAEEHDG